MKRYLNPDAHLVRTPLFVVKHVRARNQKMGSAYSGRDCRVSETIMSRYKKGPERHGYGIYALINPPPRNDPLAQLARPDFSRLPHRWPSICMQGQYGASLISHGIISLSTNLSNSTNNRSASLSFSSSVISSPEASGSISLI